MKSFAFLPAVLAAFLTPANLPASLILWQGNASASWSNGANWVGGTAPADNTTSDQAGFVFPALPAHEPNAGTRQANGIAIGDGTTAMPAFEISGTRITLGDSGIVQNPGASNTTITAILELAGNQTWANNSAGTPLLGPFSTILGLILPGVAYNTARLATADFTVANEKITTRNLDIIGRGFSMIGAGDIYFLTGRLGMSMRINAQGIPGIVFFPVSKLFEYESRGTVTDPKWSPKIIPQMPKIPPLGGKKKPATPSTP